MPDVGKPPCHEVMVSNTGVVLRVKLRCFPKAAIKLLPSSKAYIGGHIEGYISIRLLQSGGGAVPNLELLRTHTDCLALFRIEGHCCECFGKSM